MQPDILRLGPASLVEEKVVTGLNANQDMAEIFGLFLVQEGSANC